MDERKRLIEELLARENNQGYLDIDKIVDFIISDRRKVVEPLVKYKIFRRKTKRVWGKTHINDAIDQTLKNFGIDQ